MTDKPKPPMGDISGLQDELVSRSNGVAGTYSGGVKWAVVRHDVDDKPVFMEFKSEKEARLWHKGFMEAYLQWCVNNPLLAPEGQAPELVATRIHWQVQE